MERPRVKRLIDSGAKSSTDGKNPQQRQVVAAAGKLRIQVSKGNPYPNKKKKQ